MQIFDMPEARAIARPSIERIEYGEQKSMDPFVLQSTESFKSGPLKTITVPATWARHDSDYLARGSMSEFLSKDGSRANMTVLDNGRSFSPESLAHFKDLLMRKSHSTESKVLSEQEISELSEVLGRTTFGDNQFSNKHSPPDPRSPAFHLSGAHCDLLNGKQVLEVEGAFVDQDGTAKNFYRGIFVPGENNKVLQIYMHAPSQKELDAHKELYNEMVNSISWR